MREGGRESVMRIGLIKIIIWNHGVQDSLVSSYSGGIIPVSCI